MRKNSILDKIYLLTPLENVYCFFFKKLQFSGVNVILFSPEYQKKIFSDKQKDAFLGNKNREIIATGA